MYFDYAGSCINGNKAMMKDIYDNVINQIYGNPHTDNSLQTRINNTRSLILKKLFNANEDEYTCIFTSGATDAIKILHNYLPINSLTYTTSNHNSVTGLKHGVKNIIVLDNNFNEINKWGENTNIGINLLAFPAESNFTGNIFDLNKVNEYQSKGYLILLDAAKYITSHKLDLSLIKPDFIPISFYKLFGSILSGLGCLIVKKTHLSLFNKDYYGGGTYDLHIPQEKEHYKVKKTEERFEDGTINFTSILILNLILTKYLSSFDVDIGRKCALYAYYKLKLLKHSNGTNMCEIYGFENPDKHGSIVSFNLLNEKGEYIGYKEFEMLCNANNIKIRSGAFCNPGESSYYLKLNTNTLLTQFSQGHTCSDNKDLIDGKPTGAIRISFGNYSTRKDIDKFITFVSNHYRVVLNESYTSQSNNIPRIISIYIYPIKGALPFRVNNWPITKTGLKHDREFIIYDSKNKSVTLKSNVKLSYIKPEIDLYFNKCILTNTHTHSSISFFIDNLYEMKDIVNNWISNTLEEEGCKLIKCDNDSNFSNTSQYLLLNKQSLLDLNYRILNNNQYFNYIPSMYLKNKLVEMRYTLGYDINEYRFRPNILIDGVEAYKEEEIKTFVLNDIVFNKDIDCVRCYTTTVDSNKNKMDDNLEPMKTLNKYKKVDGKVTFGVLFNIQNVNNAFLCEGEINF